MRHPLQITTPDVSASNATVIVAGEVFNNVKCDSISVGIEIEILSPTGDKLYERISRHKTHPRQKAREYVFDSIMIEKPLLWDTESPNLYTVTVSLLNDDGEVVDSVDGYIYFPGDSCRFPNMMFYQSEANTSGMGPNFYDQC